ncbi:murein L,D-transpeptidase catalytic domain family protein [Bdellovibrio sp. HCB2-146]|uniref:murein L,D-transpeptidase catalytic domain family protein n=1 Tax=Bdellovibrio sp. HCB2-146 TaxID=3394362 RepID=UPI0039BD5237
MTNSNQSFSVVRFGKQALLLTCFLAFSACGGNDYSNAERLPDDPSDEKVVDTIDTPSTETDDTQTDTSQPVAEEPANESEVSASAKAEILKQYDHLDPNRVVKQSALEKAVLYFHNNKSKFKNRNYISLIDFSKRSTQARFYIIDMNSGGVWAIHVAHGKGSDPDHDGYAQKFSNSSGSNASSLGYYRAAETYTGKHGLSLRLDGLSSTNSKARSRAVVIHGADYVKEASVIQGRSWGCPAVTMSYRTKVINALKGGSLIYAFAN